MTDGMKDISILLVEDDINLGYLMVENLEAKGIAVTLAKTGKEGLDAITKQQYDLVILDIMLPETDGLTLGARLKALYPTIPFIFVSARRQEADRIAGFETGADDYITKPFSFKELYYRIMVILKRMQLPQASEEPKQLSLGKATFYTSERILRIDGNDRKLSKREAEVLTMLMVQAGNFVGRSEILKLVWGNDDYFSAKSMDVYITRLRKLLKDDPRLEIENLYGSGYRIKVNEQHM